MPGHVHPCLNTAAIDSLVLHDLVPEWQDRRADPSRVAPRAPDDGVAPLRDGLFRRHSGPGSVQSAAAHPRARSSRLSAVRVAS
jgi:hypothetical protein